MVIKNVSGVTGVYGIIGNPVGHSLSPIVQNTFAAAAGHDIVYTAFPVAPDGLEDAVRGAHSLNIKGLNVTVPYKKDIIKYLSHVDSTASRIGAVNTLKRVEDGYVGYNTDMIGMYYAFKGRGIALEGKTILLLGAGGCACAAAVMAGENHAKKLIIANRSADNAVRLQKRIKKYYDFNVEIVNLNDIQKIPECDIIINTTTVGFADNVGKSPLPLDFFSQRNIEAVFDAIYSPWRTTLLEYAENVGITAINGFDMLIYQAVAAQEIWLDMSFDTIVKENVKHELELFYKQLNMG